MNDPRCYERVANCSPGPVTAACVSSPKRRRRSPVLTGPEAAEASRGVVRSLRGMGEKMGRPGVQGRVA
jgi:hypothetical protein